MNIRSLMERKEVVFGSGVVVGTALGYLLFIFLKEKELQKAIDECNAVTESAVKQSEIATEALDEARKHLSENEVKKSEGSDLALKVEEYKKLYSGEDVDYNLIHPDRGVTDPAELESPSDDYDGNVGEEDVENNVETDPDEFAGEVREANYYAAERRKPKLIKEDTFEYDGRNIYDKIDLYYYTGDDVLASEDEEVIDNVDHTVGDCLDKFGFRENDEGEIYVRNFYTMTDYRITKMFAEFGGLQR